MGECAGQAELFNIEPAKPRLATAPAKPRFTKFQGTRVLCDDCVRAIHRLGVAVAPYPRGARYRVTMPGGDVARVCDAHRQQRMT